MSKILVTGSTGMLGGYVVDGLQAGRDNLILSTRDTIDLNAPNHIRSFIEEMRPEVIVHLAAETDVDLCERQPELAMLRNFMATKAIAEAAKEVCAKLVYISTSNVFGLEGKLSYNELDSPSPLNYYGMSKLRGEEAVTRSGFNDWVVIRAGWMIGGGQQRDHKFVGKVISQAMSGVAKIKAVDDKFGTITPASKLADFIVWAIRNNQKGLYHFACPGATTRYKIAKLICEQLGQKIEVEPVKSNMFPLSAPRPGSESIESLTLRLLPDAPNPLCWEKELIEYISTFSS